ncbi:hypothetical protein CANCADRAFT_102015 [Tortispora caseinolytica NRRL Y-17796]|uniref:Secreted protein n=1 Tax=Tortispora caseinolytica NRRL Y-17796 TaxID=767744 RepID=A0A1E4TEI3_9ASCO|nr:hypothetical protein CANCADRAFT_102015 [Tortispora caseinolytica NRRL Y-17796]
MAHLTAVVAFAALIAVTAQMAVSSTRIAHNASVRTAVTSNMTRLAASIAVRTRAVASRRRRGRRGRANRALTADMASFSALITRFLTSGFSAFLGKMTVVSTVVANRRSLFRAFFRLVAGNTAVITAAAPVSVETSSGSWLF